MSAPRRGALSRARTIVLAAAARAYLRLVAATARKLWLGPTVAELAARGVFPCVGTFWHSRLVWPAILFRGGDYAVLVSDHRDGELIARIVGGWGTRAVEGSSLRGGVEALRATHRLLASGVSVSIAPDGPLGPREIAKEGAVALASLSGRPIVPFSYAAAPALAFGSWDRLRVPLPFARVALAMGEPIAVPPGLDAAGVERHRSALESELRRLDALSAEALRARGEPVTGSA